jgi:hypothetical protein
MRSRTTIPFDLLNDKVNSIFKLSGKILITAGILMAAACSGPGEQDTWTLNCDTDASESCAYVDANGTTMIDCEKYLICFSDTFDNYAIVGTQDEGIVAINRQEEILYQVFVYDNGPDYPSDGYFRILQDGKMGYADAPTGESESSLNIQLPSHLKINMLLFVSNCDLIEEKDHYYWTNGQWGLIDKNGTMVVEPQYDDIIEISNTGEALVILQGEEKRIKIE